MSDNCYSPAATDDSVFRQALECSGLGFWDHDFTTQTVVRSNIWARMLGYEPQEIENRLNIWLDLIHPDDLPLTLDTAAAHEAGHLETFSVEHRMKAKDGRWLWIHNFGKIVERDEHGRPKRALGFHRDITAEKDAAEALKDSEEKYRSVVEECADNIFLVDVDTRCIIQANDALGRFLGYSREEILRLTIYDFVAHPRADIDEIIARVQEHKRLFMSERQYRRKNNSLVPVEVGISCITLRDKKVLSAVSRDISHRKKAEEQMRAIHDQLEQRVHERTIQLHEANLQLQREREALNQKNTALREILQELDASRVEFSRQIKTNIEKSTRPYLTQLEADTNPRVGMTAGLLRQAIETVTVPLVNEVETEFDRLTCREIQICEMIRNGLRIKEIASILGTSPDTVRKQRTIIRRKLGLTHSNTNLSSYLRRLRSDEEKSSKS